MKKILAILIISISVSCSNTKVEKKYALEEAITRSLEEAYFEGQRDYLEGDIRISKIGDAHGYKWIKSPWDNGELPLFNPQNNIKHKIEL